MCHRPSRPHRAPLISTMAWVGSAAEPHPLLRGEATNTEPSANGCLATFRRTQASSTARHQSCYSTLGRSACSGMSPNPSGQCARRKRSPHRPPDATRRALVAERHLQSPCEITLQAAATLSHRREGVLRCRASHRARSGTCPPALLDRRPNKYNMVDGATSSSFGFCRISSFACPASLVFSRSRLHEHVAVQAGRNRPDIPASHTRANALPRAGKRLRDDCAGELFLDHVLVEEIVCGVMEVFRHRAGGV